MLCRSIKDSVITIFSLHNSFCHNQSHPITVLLFIQNNFFLKTSLNVLTSIDVKFIFNCLFIAFFKIGCNITYTKVGCFKDDRKKKRPLPDILFTDRDPSMKKKWSGYRIDWKNWDEYIVDVVCRCANAANAKKYSYFSVQHYGDYFSVFACSFYIINNFKLIKPLIPQVSKPGKFAKVASFSHGPIKTCLHAN